LLQQLFDLLDRTRKQERMVHHDFQILSRRQLNQLFRLRNVAGEWLLDENMLAVL